MEPIATQVAAGRRSLSDQTASPAKPELSAAERRARQVDRLATIRLRMAIWRVLDERGLGSPAEVGAALRLPAAAAAGLLARHQ